MSVWAQYLTFLVVGLFYYLALAAAFAVAAGFSTWALALALALAVFALVIGGYASGLSFFAPQLAAAVGGGAAALFLIWTVSLLFLEGDELFYGLMPLPAIAALIVSGVTIRKRPPAVWAPDRSATWKTVVGILARLPAVLATWVLVESTARLLRFS